MDDKTTYLAFGSFIAIIGMVLIFVHVAKQRSRLSGNSLSEEDHRFYSQQYRRRMQTSALTVTLGALIALCGQLNAFEESPVFATAYVIGLLILAFWLVLLALGDAAASRIHSNHALRQNRKARRVLEDALIEIQKSKSTDDQT